MTTVTVTGFQRDTQGSWIAKDPEATLTYTFDWSQWLEAQQTIATVAYTVQTRSNDPDPVIKVTEGVIQNTKTYVELSGGQLGKTYTVTADITTNNAQRDRRYFRVKIEERSA